MHHYYSTTKPTSHTNQYEPPANDSIIQGATSTPIAHLTGSMTTASSHNRSWQNNGSDTATQQMFLTLTTNTVDCNGLFSDFLDSSNNRNGPTCFWCGEQGHMRNECTSRVFCSNCKSGNHCNRTCRKIRNNTPSPINNHTPTGYHPTATPPPLNDQNPAATGTVNNRLWFQNHQELN